MNDWRLVFNLQLKIYRMFNKKLFVCLFLVNYLRFILKNTNFEVKHFLEYKKNEYRTQRHPLSLTNLYIEVESI